MSDYSTSASESDSEVEQVGKRKHVDASEKKITNKKRKKELLKPPTTQELNDLRETESLFSSNLVRLQIEELLSNISLKEKDVNQFTLWWTNFQKKINNIVGENDILLSDIQDCETLHEDNDFVNELVKHKLHVKYDRDFTLKFPKPNSSIIFGGYQLKCLIKSNMHININIKMPSECLSFKDYLNNRYFIKRHYYILYILHSIRYEVLSTKIELLVHEHSKFLPIVQITPQYSAKVKINLFVTGAEDFFNLNRFLPDRNNIKFSFDDKFADVDAKSFGDIGTPLYNSFLAKDFTLLVNYQYIENALNTKNIQDGLKLLMLWLTQRECNKGLGNFSNELLFYTMAYLVKKKKINTLMSSYQIIRIFWSFLINTTWNEEPISLCEDVKVNVMDMYKNNYDVVFLDITGLFNVTSFLHLGVYLKLKREAHLALTMLDANKSNCFTSLFRVKMTFSLQYDAIVKFDSTDSFKNIYDSISPQKKWKYYGFYHSLIINEINEILRRGFTKRVTSIIPYICENYTIYAPRAVSNFIMFGINLNPEHAFNVIERGPSEEDPVKVKEFQEFWKGFTSFRRFQDSTAAEVVYFPCRTLQDKRNIFTKILDFQFTKKYPVQMQIISNQFEKVLKLQKTIIHFPTGTNEEACLKVKHMYTDLSKKLRDLDLPLMIANIQGSSDVFSYTDVFPPIPTSYRGDTVVMQHTNFVPPYVAPIECVIQLGKSSGWPDEIDAVRSTKCEFYLRISELLESDHDIPSSVTLDHLDIFYEGLVFRFRLYVPKELRLLKKCVSDDNVIAYKDNEESLKLEKELEILPKITSALSGIHQRYPSFGPCCALVKRWIRSHMIDDYHISDTVINLWNASVYLSDPPFETATLPQVAFLRFLKHLTDFNSICDPIIVNFNDDIDSMSLSGMEAKFHESRNNFPNLYIICPYDEGKSVFTKPHPTKEILKRIRLLATECFKFIDTSIMNWGNLSIENMFVPSNSGYDALLHLKSFANPLEYQNVSQDGEKTDKNFIEKFDKTISTKMPVIGFNPVHNYITELREMYGEYALFFHDSYGGKVIGMLWCKNNLEPRVFKASQVNGKELVGGKLFVNTKGILDDIVNRGFDILENGILINKNCK